MTGTKKITLSPRDIYEIGEQVKRYIDVIPTQMVIDWHQQENEFFTTKIERLEKIREEIKKR